MSLGNSNLGFSGGVAGGGGGMAIGGSITSATVGSVLFVGTGSVLEQDNANFFWDNSNNRLGIGNAIPAYPLDITGVIRGSADAIINGLTVGKGFTNNDSATAFGVDANLVNTSLYATAFGYQALKNNTSGGFTAIGYQAGFSNITGGSNTAVGYQSLYSNNGSWNTSVGSNCMTFATGSQNSGFGFQALDSVSGTYNVGMGYRSLRFLTSGTLNTAVGGNSSSNIGTGSNNTTIGYGALGFGTPNNANSNNVAIGYTSLWQALGNNNTALGYYSGRFIANGSTAATAISNSILIGYNTKVLDNSQTNQIVIGYDETGLGSNTTIIGNSSTVTTALRGNLLLGSTTDASYKLDVNGTARIQNKLSVGTPSASSAVLEVTSTTQGFLQPRMTTVEKNAIATPATSLQVFDTTNNTPNYYTGTSWANMGGSVYKTAVQDIGTSENLVSGKIRPVKRLIFRGSTGPSGTVTIPLTGYSPELILNLTGTFVLDATFTVPLNYSSYSIVGGDVVTTNISITYRPSTNLIQISATGTYAGEPNVINSSYVAIIEFQEV